MKVRLARESDLEALIGLGEKMRLESRTYFPPVDKEYTRAILKAVLTYPEVGCCLVAEEEEVIGFIVGEVGAYCFSPEKIAKESLWYVIPEKRNSSAGGRLLARFESWSSENGAFGIRVGLHTGAFKDLDKVGGSLERLGFICIGKDYIKYG